MKQVSLEQHINGGEPTDHSQRAACCPNSFTYI